MRMRASTPVYLFGATPRREGCPTPKRRRPVTRARLMTVDAPLAPTSPPGHVVRLLQHTNDKGGIRAIGGVQRAIHRIP